MMQKHIIFIVFTLLFSFSASAQLDVAFSTTSTPVPGGTVDVDVSVSNFDDIVTLQYFILWDSLVLSYDSIFNVTDQLEQFSIGSVGTPATAVTLDDGEMSVSWSHSSTEPFSIPDGTRLFTVRMNVVGSDCDSTAIAIGDIPPFQNIEVIDADFNDIGAVSNMLPFAIPGTDCGSGGGGGGGGGSNDIVLSSNNVSGDAGANICIPVIVDNFTDVQTAQGSMMWDPSVLSYTGTANNVLPGNAFGENSTDQGMLGFNWFDGSGVTPQNLANGTTLFEVCFDITGAAGSSSTFKFVDSPVMIVFSDSNDEELPFTTTTSTFTVNGDGGGGGGEGDLTIRMEDVTANGSVCIPMVADNFTNIQTFQGGLMWDTSVLSYTGTENSSLPGIGIGDTNADDGMLGFNWFDDSGVTPVTLPNGGTIFEVCFDIVGSAGETSTLKIIDLTNVFIEASDADGNILDVTTETATFTVGGGGVFELSCNGTTFTSGQNGCIDILASGFEDISTIQLPMTWDASQLTYTGVDNLNSSIGLAAGAFNQTQNNVIRFSWNSTNGQGQMIPDGSVLFSICFDAVSCTGNNLSGAFEFAGDSQVLVEVGNGNGDPVTASTPACGYTIICGDPGCTMITFGAASISAPQCFGESSGSISINPTADCTEPITCTWFQGFAGGGAIDTNGSCNLTNQPAGTYVVRVTAGGYSEEMTYEIPSTPSLDIQGTIFPVTCNALGGVNVTISGGSGTYNCEWQHNGAIGCNIGGLESGTYTLLVTDAILGCSQVMDFPITVDFALSGTANVTDADCDGGSISISLNQSGNFDYNWSHPEGTNAPVQNGLDPGSYSCTITSQNGNCSTIITALVSYGGTNVEVTSVVVTDASCNGNDGAVDYSIVGGCLPYECRIEGPGGPYSCDDDLVSLTPGVYGIYVTDASGNPEIVEQFTVGMASPIDVVATTTAQTDAMLGTISTTVAGGTPGYFYEWSPADATGLLQGAPNQVDLEAGSYGLTVTDAAGCTWISPSPIIVDDETVPGAPVITNAVSLANVCGNECEGEWNATVTGSAPFVYEFTNTTTGGVTEYNALPITGLCAGEYEIAVTGTEGFTTPTTATIGGPDPIEITLAESNCADMGMSNGSLRIEDTGGNGGNMYFWSPIEDTTQNPENLPAGNYEVEVIDQLGCTASNFFTVEVCQDTMINAQCGESSTILTPNGDDVNALLHVECAEDFDNTFAVYDRWGRVVHETVNYAGGWDGTDLNGETVTEGVYYWVMDTTFENDHRIFKGYVNVIRETK